MPVTIGEFEVVAPDAAPAQGGGAQTSRGSDRAMQRETMKALHRKRARLLRARAT